MTLGVMSPLWANEVIPLQDIADRARCRPVRIRLSLRQDVSNRLRAVVRKPSLYRQDVLDHLGSDPEGVREASARVVANAGDAIFSESPQPLMAGFLANPVATTEFNDRLFAFEAVEYKSQLFRHG